MLNEERKMKIIEMIDKEGIVQIQDLTKAFRVSIYTIRRDLSDLENKGLLRRTHGGAVRIEKSAWLPTIEEGKKEAVAEKKAIALKASKYIEGGDCIFMMGSTITDMITPNISGKKITVVTNSLDVGSALSQYENIETIIIGGRVKNYKGNILGSKAVDEINGYHFDKALIPCGGVQFKAGVTTSTIDSSDFTRAVINVTRENILIADYRKIGRVTFSKICDVSRLSRIITDDKADTYELDQISKKNVAVDIAIIDSP
ncbi:MAG TPA: DeoR family transcriptional regulator [Clostridiaceae bacterium]|nr:DeoR family transcriptional regulator [Clostridiaceae bacterium]